MQLERRFLHSMSPDDSTSGRSCSPTSLNRMSDVIDPRSRSTSPESPLYHPKISRTTSGTMDRFKAPAHLQQQNDDRVLADFFGNEQVSKLNEFKQSLAPVVDELPSLNKPLQKRPSSGSRSGGRSHPSPKSNHSSPHSNRSSPNPNPADPVSTDRIGQRPSRAGSGKAKMDSPSQQRKEPDTCSIVNGASDSHEIVCDIVSEMQKLRLRLQQTAMQEIAEIDRQFSPKLLRTSSGSPTGQAGHSHQDHKPITSHSRQGSSEFAYHSGHARQGSLDFTTQTGHARYGNSDFTAQTGHARRASSDFTAQTGHAHAGSSDFTFQQLQSSHRRQSSLEHISISQGHHSRQRSFEHPVPSLSFSHSRQGSLPVDPSGLVTEVRYGTSTSTLTLSPPSGLHYESRSLERTRSPSKSRSPTPPYQEIHSQGHLRQGSLGSVSPPPVGGRDFSPPSQTANLPGYNQQPPQRRESDLVARRIASPPRDNGNKTQQPNSSRNYHQPLQSTTGSKPPPGKPQRATSSGSHTIGHPRRTSGANQEGISKSGSLPKQRPGSGTHYSTAVIKRGKKYSEGKRLSMEDSQPAPGGDYSLSQPAPGGDYSLSQPAMAESVYDRLAPPGSSYSFDLDQPEHKSLVPNATAPKSTSPGTTYRQLNPDFKPRPSPRPSPRVPPKNKAKGETMPNTSRGDPHPKLKPKTSAPAAGDVSTLVDRSPPIYPEEIQPYMTSGELKSQMQSFKYTPFTDKVKNSGNDLPSYGRKHEKSTNAILPSEQTWC